MYFTTGTEGAATRAAGIDNLVANGVKVIADDTFQITEPFFQDGIVAQAVDRARAAGVTYLVSAGNRARQSWEGTYTAMADPRAVSRLPTTSTLARVRTRSRPSARSPTANMFIALQWDEAWGEATTDLAVDVYQTSAGRPRLAFTEDTDNIATGLPSEFVGIIGQWHSNHRDLGPAEDRHAQPVHEVHRGWDPDASRSPSTRRTRMRSTRTPPRPRGALTVAASNWATPATPGGFSSRGGYGDQVLRHGRQPPRHARGPRSSPISRQQMPSRRACPASTPSSGRARQRRAQRGSQL